jgi:predicted nucleic acid-binding protein
MDEPRRLVLDTNILLRWVFGERVEGLFEAYRTEVAFCVPESCFDEARRNLPRIAELRRVSAADALAFLAELLDLVEVVEREEYAVHEAEARARMASRHETDWPIVASALVLDCPIWSEDRDFFGCGVGTWVTATAEMYLRG